MEKLDIWNVRFVVYCLLNLTREPMTIEGLMLLIKQVQKDRKIELGDAEEAVKTLVREGHATFTTRRCGAEVVRYYLISPKGKVMYPVLRKQRQEEGKQHNAANTMIRDLQAICVSNR